VSRPCLHERPALFEGIASPIGLLGFVADHMGKRCFGDFSREVRLIAGPIPKGASETVNCRADDSKAGENLCHGDV
jgi:hypothetical protein